MRPTYIKETLCNFQKILVKETPAGHLDKFGNRGTANMSKETHKRDLFKLKDTHRKHPYWRSRQTDKCQICPKKKEAYANSKRRTKKTPTGNQDMQMYDKYMSKETHKSNLYKFKKSHKKDPC